MKPTIAERNVMLDATAPNYNNGYQRWYSGTEPAADAALSGNTLLVELRYGATAFAAASGGTATANAMTGGTVVAGGTATFVRNFRSNGTSVLGHMSIGLSGAEVTTDRVALIAGDVVTTPASCTLTMGTG